MKNRCVLTILPVLLVMGFSATLARAANDPFQIGQIWTYDHQGPRTGSMDPNAIDGQRIVQVISVTDANEPQWVIEECFTNDPNVIGRLYVNAQHLLTAFDLENENGEMMTLRYARPIPYQKADIAVGEEVTIETTLGMAGQNFEMGCQVVTRRLEDETMTTPAGTFPDCLHYKTTTTLTVNMTITKVPMAEQHERWYSPTAGGVVKEVYTKEPVKFLAWSRPGYTATSTLKSFTTQQVTSDAIARAEAAQHYTPRSSRFSLRAKALTLLAALAVLLVAGFVLVKRLRR